MATETERKFLVVNVGWKFSCVASFAIRDGLIATEGGRKARVRINGSWIIGDFGGASRLSELGDDFIDEFLHFSSFGGGVQALEEIDGTGNGAQHEHVINFGGAVPPFISARECCRGSVAQLGLQGILKSIPPVVDERVEPSITACAGATLTGRRLRPHETSSGGS